MDENLKVRLLYSFIACWLIFCVLCLLLIISHLGEHHIHVIYG